MGIGVAEEWEEDVVYRSCTQTVAEIQSNKHLKMIKVVLQG